MFFFKRKKQIRLSNRLGWGVRRGILPKTKYLALGSIAIVVSIILIVNAVVSSTPPDGLVLGETIVDQVTEESPSMEFIDYTVEPEDTLFNISQKFNTPWTAIAQLNDLQPPFKIRPGMRLKVPIEK